MRSAIAATSSLLGGKGLLVMGDEEGQSVVRRENFLGKTSLRSENFLDLINI